MLLCVDIGNSSTVIGVFDGLELLHRWRLSTLPESTPDELALRIGGLLAFAGLTFQDVDGTALASVVPPSTATFRTATRRYLADASVVIVEPGVRTGIALRVDQPRDVGADRIVNAVAAHDLYGGPTVVVDFGTATQFDVISAAGEFLGGAIAPGVATSTEAMVRRTARLPTVETSRPPSAIGRSTVTALQSGIVFGAAGQVDGIVDRIVAELGPGVTTVATGGLAPAVLEACESIDHHDPSLTLKGLARVWDRNHR